MDVLYKNLSVNMSHFRFIMDPLVLLQLRYEIYHLPVPILQVQVSCCREQTTCSKRPRL